MPGPVLPHHLHGAGLWQIRRETLHSSLPVVPADRPPQRRHCENYDLCTFLWPQKLDQPEPAPVQARAAADGCSASEDSPRCLQCAAEHGELFQVRVVEPLVAAALGPPSYTSSKQKSPTTHAI
jgi:hypothetical protein